MLLHRRKSLYRVLVITRYKQCSFVVASFSVAILFTDLVPPFLASKDPRWFEAFPYLKNLPNYGIVFACTISVQNVCQNWIYKLISFLVIKIQTSFGLFWSPYIVNFRLNLCSESLKNRVNKFNFPFWRSRRNAHTFDIVLVGMEHVIWPVAGHATRH